MASQPASVISRDDVERAMFHGQRMRVWTCEELRGFIRVLDTEAKVVSRLNKAQLCRELFQIKGTRLTRGEKGALD